MRTLYVHADFMEFNVKKPTPIAEELTEDRKHGRYDEVLVAFISVEKQDEDHIDEVANKMVTDLMQVIGKVKADRVLLYPYAHLSSSLSSPDAAKKMLSTLEALLQNKSIEVHRAPFGWYKAFNISCKGHPLSELSREDQGGRKEGGEGAGRAGPCRSTETDI